ncbi:MAG: GxxExxY protein, partial [Lewinella sp.]|nr:GxxExxY protein [Lewinella sp.]
MEQQDITSTIIASAFKVHNTLGFGFLESVYQNAMIIELRKQGFRVEKQFPLEVYYEGQIVGDFKADLLVNHGITIELKAVTQLQVAHEVQLV